MAITTEEKLDSVDDLLSLPECRGYELIHGKLVERDVGTESNWLAMRIVTLLGFFLEQKPLGYVVGSETAFVCFPDDPRHAPRPDVAFIRFGRLPGEKLPKGSCPIAPDLMVEVVSPNDKGEAIQTKIAEFQAVGVPLIWVVYPNTRRIVIHRLEGSPTVRISELTEADTITGEQVIPGFSRPVADFFRVPQPKP